MEKEGILGGVALKPFYRDAFPNALIVAVTEEADPGGTGPVMWMCSEVLK